MSRDDEGHEVNDQKITDRDGEEDIEVSNPADYRPPVHVPPNAPDPDEPAPTKQAPGAAR